MIQPSTDALVARFASKQRGLITTEQALRLGWTHHQLEDRARAGVISRVMRGLYRFSAAPVTWQQSAMAAVLGAGGEAVCSHLTAAALLGLIDPPLLPHITVPPGSSARSRLAKVHRSTLERPDIVRVDGIPTAAPGRVLLDAATLLTTATLEDMVDDVLCRPLASLAVVEAAIRRGGGQGRNGTAAVLRGLEPWRVGVTPGSQAEMRLVRRIKAWGYPAPVRQHPAVDRSGRVVAYLDLAWPDRLRTLEYDGERWHGPRRREHDRARDARLRALGWTVEHVDRFDMRSGRTRLHELLAVWFATLAA